jgi:hypothetical protein
MFAASKARLSVMFAVDYLRYISSQVDRSGAEEITICNPLRIYQRTALHYRARIQTRNLGRLRSTIEDELRDQLASCRTVLNT